MTHQLYRTLRLLDEQRLWYRIDRHRDESVMITVTIVGERLEIDVFEDGHTEFSRFRGDESVEANPDELEHLLLRHGREQDQKPS